MQISSDSIDEVLYPKIEAHSTGLLKVSELHTIHWERAGNPDGVPVIVIHGARVEEVNPHTGNISIQKSST